MDIVIDFTSITDFFNQPIDMMLWRTFLLFGWIPIALAFLWGAKEVWIYYIRSKWGPTQKFLLLAIDIPRGNEQTPKAVENFFAYLGGAHGTLNLIETYWEGKFQLSFSFEVVSMEGYTQFLVRTPTKFKDLVESGIYAQYPDAEITEVDDYTKGFPTKFPDDEYDVYGWEFIQKNHFAYPIKTYKDFEDQIGETEAMYKDPLASLMDMCSSLRGGENFWYQLIVIPIGFEWPEEGEREISKILGEKIKSDDNILDKISNSTVKWLGDFSELIYQLWGDIKEKEEAEENRFKMMNLKPKEKKQVEAIQEKISKLGFKFKIRMVYIAKREVMNKNKVAGGFVGFMKQFFYSDLNNLGPDLKKTSTRTSYFFKEARLNIKKNRIMRNYINRDDWAGKLPGIFNVEELASLWHFPVESVVRAPLIQKAPGRKAVPPIHLPVGEEIVSEQMLEPIFEDKSKKSDKASSAPIIKGTPPANLPIG
ncbi:MAG: hypothetical protein ABIE43_00355 [Patescibacteria group bacterium]